MKVFQLLILFVIVLLVPGKATLTELGLDGQALVNTPSDWSEEPVEEDDSLEEDNVLTEIHTLLNGSLASPSYKTGQFSIPMESPREVTVPPPQA